MKKTSAQPLSSEALAQLEQLRAQGLTYQELAAWIPCSSGTIWKAVAGGPIARPVRWMIEARLKERVAA